MFVVDEVGALVLSGLVEKVKHLWKVPRVVQLKRKKITGNIANIFVSRSFYVVGIFFILYIPRETWVRLMSPRREITNVWMCGSSGSVAVKDALQCTQHKRQVRHGIIQSLLLSGTCFCLPPCPYSFHPMPTWL